jgi:SagB-type dehydrogenase family enzyme
MKNQETVFTYHQETKHHSYKYAKSLGYMDWANQPNPFRFYEDAPRITLPLVSADTEIEAQYLFTKKDQSSYLSVGTLAYFLELSIGLSAWKGTAEDKWSLRMNPSSGNLHPTEVYLILPSIGGYPCGVYHYSPYLHALELLRECDTKMAQKIEAQNGFAVVLTTIIWREAWKYGERCFRYCNHDVGHALGTLKSSANMQGWSTEQLALSDIKLEEILGFDAVLFTKEEDEIAESLIWIGDTCNPKLFDAFTASELKYRPNTLSSKHQPWPILQEVAKATANEGLFLSTPSSRRHTTLTSVFNAPKIVRKRRSAQSFNPYATAMTKRNFEAILQTTIENNYFEFASLLDALHLSVFVHNVEEMRSGLYLLVRNENHVSSLKASMKSVLLWEKVEGDLPLYFLAGGDVKAIAQRISCNQEIAKDSHFSLGMIAEFKTHIEKNPVAYKHLFWESGLIGQALYFSAESKGYKGTGIGCFLDDEMHNVLGIEDMKWQDIYHFTVGEAIVDMRLQSSPAYDHLKNEL